MIDKSIEVELSIQNDFQSDLERFESEFAVKLPEIFREFLMIYGLAQVQAKVDILEPMPFGNEASVEYIFGFNDDRSDSLNLFNNTEISQGAPVIIPFASNCVNNWFYLYLGKNCDLSQVYIFDPQYRYSWDDDKFYNMFPNLHPAIKQYLDLRKKGQLPTKKKGFENFYKISDNFNDFLNALKADMWD